MNKPFKIILSVVGIIILSVIAVFAGSALLYSIPAQPISSVSFSGTGNYNGTLSDLKISKNLKDICNKNQCENYSESKILPVNQSFAIVLSIDKNNELYILKFKDGRVTTALFQKRISPPSAKTFSVLHNIENSGIELNYDGGEKWLCNGKKLNKNNCTRVVKKVEKQNLITALHQEYGIN